MGQTESHPSCYKVVQRDGDFVIVSNEPAEQFQFDPAESYAVSYGIDRQTSPNFQHKQLSKLAVDDARQVLDSLVDVGAIPSNHSRLYAASKEVEKCKTAGMKETFQEQALKVGPNGLFVFHFSGHGIRIQRTKEVGLAPVDFDYSRETYLTADVLSNWLDEAQCKAKHILITLDCCYAGGIAKELTSFVQTPPKAGLYVISACTAYETSLVLGPLGHSIFTFFLSYAVRKLSLKPGQLPVKEIFEECKVCSESLSSLLVSYNHETGLKFGTMQPQMQTLNLNAIVKEIMGEGEDQTDAAAEVGRFKYAMNLYDRSKGIPPLDDKSLAFLESMSSAPYGPLMELQNRDILNGRVFQTALCSMMHSVASIELACDTKLEKIQNPNHSITTFYNVIAAIDMVHNGVQCPENIFFLGWLFYREVLVMNDVNVNGLKRLHRKLSRSKEFSAPILRVVSYTANDSTDSGDFTDSAEQEVDTDMDEFSLNDLPHFQRWKPIVINEDEQDINHK